MSHFGAQNGSFWSVKRCILKIGPDFFVFRNGFFSVSEVFVSLKREKISAENFGINHLQILSPSSVMCVHKKIPPALIQRRWDYLCPSVILSAKE